MKKKEAERLREIADLLDEHFLDIWHENHNHGWWLHSTATEIRKVIMDAGFNGFIDAKYSKVEAKWELNKEEK